MGLVVIIAGISQAGHRFKFACTVDIFKRLESRYPGEKFGGEPGYRFKSPFKLFNRKPGLSL